MNVHNIWKYILTLILGILLGLAIYSTCLEPKISDQPVKIEYIEKHDTIKVDKETIRFKTDTIVKIDTLVKVDTVIQQKDGTFVYLPKEFYEYHDVIKNDSVEADILIKYSGIYSSIDSLNIDFKTYNQNKTFYKEKQVRPFIYLQAGPEFNQTFRKLGGMSYELGIGTTIKNGWGVMGSYELSTDLNQINHSVKVGIVKQF